MVGNLIQPDTIAPAILEELSRTVLAIGPLIDRAYREEVDFDDWVACNLPFSEGTAERIRCMWMVWRDRPENPNLPEPWHALWTLG